MDSLSSCPACNASLSLFTPREISRHINACLDAQPSETPRPDQNCRCPVCNRNLTDLTMAARAEHENRCVDNLSPNRERNTRRVQTRTPRRPRSPKEPAPQDDRLRRFLELLGLERYMQKFTDEEIDFPALRLLQDFDFAHLRIPDAARRRIADALTAVPVLAQIEGAEVENLPLDPAPPPTQNFSTSKLGHQMQRSNALLQLDDSDGEYAPTPPPKSSPSKPADLGDQPSHERIIDETREDIPTHQERKYDDNERDEFDEIERLVKSTNAVSDSEGSDVSSIPSDPEDLRELLSSTSQITLELKLRKWRRKQIENEKKRHEHELQRIEEEYMNLATSKKISRHASKKKPEAPDVPRLLEQDCDTIDLTQDVPVEEDRDQNAPGKLSTTKNLGESIVISSNESVVKTTNRARTDKQELNKGNDACMEEEKEFVEAPENTVKSSTGSQSPCSETCTPVPSKTKEADEEEEVINLISAEKKRPPRQDSRDMLSLNQSNNQQTIEPEERQEGRRRVLTSDSDEDFIDLLGVEKENTRSSSRPTSAATDAQKRSSTENHPSAMEEASTQTRLKKRPKKGKRVMATSEDIAQLIRTDKTLYEDILMMESIPFDRILTRLRGGEKHVTKKALYNFLQDEGILFKWDSVEPGSQQESYMRLLNSDRCPD